MTDQNPPPPPKPQPHLTVERAMYASDAQCRDCRHCTVVLGFVKDAAFPLLKDGTPVVITDADGGVIKRDKVTRIEHQKKPINLADPGVEVGMALENSHSDDLAPGMIIWTASDFLATH